MCLCVQKSGGKVDAGDGAARPPPFPHASAHVGEGRHAGGPSIDLLEPSGDQARKSQDKDGSATKMTGSRSSPFQFHLIHRLGGHVDLDCFSFFIAFIQNHRDSQREIVVVHTQQACTEVGLVYARSCVDPGAKGESGMIGCEEED